MKQKPNVILIVMDTARADHLSCYGYSRKTTPNIDKIARQGVLFENAFSTAPWTPPSHASIFTGKYPSHHKTFGRNVQFKNQDTSLAQILSSNGYRCIGVTSSPLLGLGSGFETGFHEYVEMSDEHFLSNLSSARLWTKDIIRTIIFGPDKSSYKVTELVKGLLKKHCRERAPFFLFVNYLGCHVPYDPPRPFKGRFCDNFNESRLYIKEFFLKKMLRRTSETVSDQDLDIQRLQWIASGKGGVLFSMKKSFVSEKEWEIVKLWYDGEIAYLDFLIGDLVDFLRDSDLFDNTLMIITSDHGENFGEHGLAGHALCVYDSVLHVPLIVSFPSLIIEEKRIRNLVSIVDIFPTILDVAGVKFGEKISGKSLLPFEERKMHGFICAEYAGLHFMHAFGTRTGSLELDRIDKGCKCIRNPVYKYIITKDPSSEKEELFNVLRDPFEQVNVIAEYPDEAQHLKEQLQNVLDLSYFGPPELPDNHRMMDRLRALGYL